MSVALGPFFWFGRYEWIACNSYGQRGEVQWSEKYLSINTKFFQISRILGIFRLAIFILQLTNSSGASAGNSWGQRGVVQWTVQRSRTFFKAAIASNTWCTPFYEYWRRNISFIFYSRWYLAATAVIMTFKCEQECCLLTNVKSDSEQNKTWKDNPAVSEQNKTWKDNPAVSWIVSPLSGKYDTKSGESMFLNWFLNKARYKLCQICIKARCMFPPWCKRNQACARTPHLLSRPGTAGRASEHEVRRHQSDQMIAQ